MSEEIQLIVDATHRTWRLSTTVAVEVQFGDKTAEIVWYRVNPHASIVFGKQV